MSPTTPDARADEPADWTHRETIVDHGQGEPVRLHYVESGEGDPVVLLHGFPEFWYSWRQQLPALADAGFRAVAPDLRGYNRSEKPHGVAAYRLHRLVDDVVGLIEHLGADAAHVVGHDWGGLVAWELAGRRPEVVDRLTILNAPHPAVYERALRSLDQLRRSWYVGYFQLPWLPETGLAAFHGRFVGRLFEDGAVDPDAFTDADVERYCEAASRPGAMRSAVNYYRALFRSTLRKWARRPVPGLDPPPGALQAREIGVPTLLLWGLQDEALAPRLTEGLDRWVPDLRVRRFEDASHWLQNDASERVTEELLAFLGGDE